MGACSAGSAKGFEVALALENALGGECPTTERDKDVCQTKGMGMVSVRVTVNALSMLNTLIKARNKTHKSC